MVVVVVVAAAAVVVVVVVVVPTIISTVGIGRKVNYSGCYVLRLEDVCEITGRKLLYFYRYNQYFKHFYFSEWTCGTFDS